MGFIHDVSNDFNDDTTIIQGFTQRRGLWDFTTPEKVQPPTTDNFLHETQNIYLVIVERQAHTACTCTK